MTTILQRFGILFGRDTPGLVGSAADALSGAFPSLDEHAIAHLHRLGTVRNVVKNFLVSEMDDPTLRVVLLVDGVVTIERPRLPDIEVSAGVAWNELTWASRGRVMGGRLHAGAHGATLIEWRGKRLRSLAMNHPALYGALTDAVMRSAGVHHTLQLEKARFVPPASLRRQPSMTLNEIAPRKPGKVASAGTAA